MGILNEKNDFFFFFLRKDLVEIVVFVVNVAKK